MVIHPNMTSSPKTNILFLHISRNYTFGDSFCSYSFTKCFTTLIMKVKWERFNAHNLIINNLKKRWQNHEILLVMSRQNSFWLMHDRWMNALHSLIASAFIQWILCRFWPTTSSYSLLDNCTSTLPFLPHNAILNHKLSLEPFLFDPGFKDVVI